MPNKHTLDLLAVTLAGQAEPAPLESELDETRLREVLTGRSVLAASERKQLLRSPAARRQLYFLADILRAETYARWRQAAIDTELLYQAAASSSVEPLQITSNPYYSLSLFPLDSEGRAWTLYLKLSAQLRQQVITGVRLIDDEEQVWLAGKPDSDGELSGDWHLPGSPIERLRQTKLHLKPL
ncbi:MAG: hypothetical protein HC808_19720 [Candidatus Competibacteraceae bacterium]|nr:hypothetical protein [Candidatus Competibacteraceae bacterium]